MPIPNPARQWNPDLDRLTPIGLLHTCFRQRFAIPRQAGLAPEAPGELRILPPFDQPDAFRGLQGFSHLWLIVLFHDNRGRGWKPLIRPPRLGGARKVGVFASRSPLRPNPIGLSAVVLESLHLAPGDVRLRLSGVDLLDGTPVLDIKPYLPYADSLPTATGGFAPNAPMASIRVIFTPEARQALEQAECAGQRDLTALVRRLVALDPRPAYLAHTGHRDHFGMRLGDLDIRWRITDDLATLYSVEFAPPELGSCLPVV